MYTVLSYGMGVESTAVLIRWLNEPALRPCPLSELILVSSQTGDEYEDTQRDVETLILPRLREHNIRYVQLARRGHLEADGIVILSDSRETQRLFIKGAYKLSDELRTAGTLPQYSGEHTCSLKFKAWVIEQWMAHHLHHPVRHALGYNANETDRVLKSEAANLRRVAFGYNVDEQARIDKAILYDTPQRQSFYPLVEWGWSRQDCLEYLFSVFGIVWQRSACVQCPFNALKEDALARQKRHPQQVAETMMLEHVSLSLNPRGTLYRNQSLIEIADVDGNAIATEAYRLMLENSLWAVYRVRRVYNAAKDKSGRLIPEKKGTAIRAVERLTENVPKSDALDHLGGLVLPTDEAVVVRGITYIYRRRCGVTFPTREEFFVAAPGVVETKARYGLDWFEQRWEQPQQSLFPLDYAA